MSAEDDKSVVRRFWEEAFGQEAFGRDGIEVMDELFAANFTLHDLVYKERRRLQGLKRIVRDSQIEMPGIQVEVDDQRLDVDGRVFTRFTVRVPPPQDKTYTETDAPGEGWAYIGISISRVSGGKIQESWVVWEAIRASQELSGVFGSNNWRWPPWR